MFTYRITCMFALLGILVAFNIPVKAEPKVDFNGDGRADIFLQNPFTKEIAAWLTDGSRVIDTISFTLGFDSSEWTLFTLNDFNGDGLTDMLWYNTTTFEYEVALFSKTLFSEGGGSIQTVGYGVAEDPSIGWASLAVDDFNGDNRADLLWYNGRSGQLRVWLLSENGLLGSVDYRKVPITDGWTPAAVGDFNGDGRADVLLYNVTRRALVAWFLSEGGLLGGTGYGIAEDPNTGWATLAVDDFNGDGRADLLWFNGRTGHLKVWLLSENNLQTVDYPPVGIAKGWTPAAVGDFNGDGRADVLWYNVTHRALSAWFLSEEGLLGWASYGIAEDPSVGWSWQGLDDFNGDGRLDVIWRNLVDNRTKAWLIGDSGVLEEPFYNDLEPSSMWLLGIPN